MPAPIQPYVMSRLDGTTYLYDPIKGTEMNYKQEAEYWKDKFNETQEYWTQKLKACIENYEAEHRVLEDQLVKLSNNIAILEASIPKPPRQKIFVVAENYEEFRRIITSPDFIVAENTEYVYLHDACDLRGYSNPNVIFVGDWIKHPNILQIIEQIKIATRY